MIARPHTLLFLLALAAMACGQPQSPSGAPWSNADEPAPKYGGTLNLRINQDFWDYDYVFDAKSPPNRDATQMTYDTLVELQTGRDIPYAGTILAPRLAERWEVSADAKAFTFHLRRGIAFQDQPPVHARMFSSADVAWSLEYLARVGRFGGPNFRPGQMAWMLEGLTSVETPDAYTAVAHFKEPFVPFLSYAALPPVPMMPKEIYEQAGNYQDHAVGTGPFILDTNASQKGSRWVFRKNPAHWEAGKPYLDHIRFLVIAEESTAHAAFASRQADLLTNLDPLHVEEVAKANPQAARFEAVSPSPNNMYMTAHKPPFSDPRLRRAVSLALDRDELVRVLARGKGTWAMAGALPDTWTLDEIKGILRFDPEETRRLIAEAGYPDGLDIDYVPYGSSTPALAQAELLQAQLKRVGMNLKLRVQPDAASSARLLHRCQFDMMAMSKALFADVDSYLHATYYSKSGTNYQCLNDPKLDGMIEAQRREPDPAKRRALVRQASRYINENAIGLALYSRFTHQTWQPYVKNYYPSWEGNARREIWLER